MTLVDLRDNFLVMVANAENHPQLLAVVGQFMKDILTHGINSPEVETGVVLHAAKDCILDTLSHTVSSAVPTPATPTEQEVH